MLLLYGFRRKEKTMAALRTLGLGKTMETKLHSVGIHAAEELMDIGSKEAVSRLKAQYPNTCVVILYYLEAAIREMCIRDRPEHWVECLL